MDNRNKKLAKVLVHYSTKIKKGEKVWIDCIGASPIPLLDAVVEEIIKAGALPFYQILDQRITRRMLEYGSAGMWKGLGHIDRQRMKEMDAYIGIRGQDNIFQLSGIPQKAITDPVDLMVFLKGYIQYMV